MDLINTLISCGLTKKQAEIYLAALQLKSAPASRIAKKVDGNRTTIYHHLLEMCEQGIASVTTKNDVQWFSVISPEDLYEKYQMSVSQLKKNLPELYSLYETYGQSTEVKFYDGLEATKHAYLDKLNHGEEFWAFLGINGIDPRLKEFMYDEYLEKKFERGVTSNVILSNTEKNQQFVQNDTKEKRNSLIINHPLLRLDCEIDIYGSNRVCVIMGSDKSVSGVIIQNQHIHQALKSLFDILRDTFNEK